MPDSTKKQVRELEIDAVSYSKIGHHSKAESTIKKALELKPRSNHLNHELAKIHLRAKQYEKALEILLTLSNKTKDREDGTYNEFIEIMKIQGQYLKKA